MLKTIQPLENGEQVNIKMDGLVMEAFVSPFNKRVRLLDYKGARVQEVPRQLKEIAGRRHFATKIFAKVHSDHQGYFLKEGFVREGKILGYFNGEDASAVSFFENDSRKATPDEAATQEEEILRKVQSIDPQNGSPRELEPGYSLIIAGQLRHFQDLAGIYKQVFKTYPFPIFDSDYLARTAESHIIYAIIYDQAGDPVAGASAEMDREHRNAEMTDFATLPSQRGKGLAGILLDHLEKKAYDEGVRYFYTIARSRSFGMNLVFHRAGYNFTGKLKNNCSICGQLENMSIWCKPLE